MATANPFVAVANCKEQLDFYRGILGGETRILRRQDDKVLNAELHLGGSKITFADVEAAKPAVKGDYVKVMVKLDSEDEFRKAHDALADGGLINVAIYEAPFNGLLAVVTDRNGIGWVLSYYRAA